MPRTRQQLRVTQKVARTGSPLLLTMLCISCATLVLQLFPGMLWTGLAIADVRGWTWRTYAVLCSVSIVVLMAVQVYVQTNQER